MALPLVIAAKADTFRGLERRATSFSVAAMALRDIPMCCNVFDKVWKGILCDSRNTFEGFSEDGFDFFWWQAQHFAGVNVHFSAAGAALQTCSVKFLLRTTLAVLPQAVTKCKCNGRRGAC